MNTYLWTYKNKLLTQITYKEDFFFFGKKKEKKKEIKNEERKKGMIQALQMACFTHQNLLIP